MFFMKESWISLTNQSLTSCGLPGMSTVMWQKSPELLMGVTSTGNSANDFPSRIGWCFAKLRILFSSFLCWRTSHTSLATEMSRGEVAWQMKHRRYFAERQLGGRREDSRVMPLQSSEWTTSCSIHWATCFNFAGDKENRAPDNSLRMALYSSRTDWSKRRNWIFRSNRRRRGSWPTLG